MSVLEKEKIKEWISTLANAAKTLIENKDFNDEICTTNTDKAEIHIYKGARKIAESLGFELQEKSWNYEGATATHICFEYEGVTFYELENYMVGEL